MGQKGKRMRKIRKIAIFVVLTLVTCLFGEGKVSSAELDKTFSDITEDYWAYDNIMTLVEDEGDIIAGYPDGTFRPTEILSVDQFIAMVVRAAGFEPGNSQDYWAQGYIDKAMDLGILEEREFEDYTQAVTREEMSRIIIRTLDYLGQDTQVDDPTQVLQVVNDSEDFGYQFDDYIMKTYKLGIITGYSDHTFRPQGNLSRAEAAAVIVRMIDPTMRIAFDFDALYDAMYSDVSSHLYGGADWVDPTTAGIDKNVEEDVELLTSDLEYEYSKTFYDYYPMTLLSEDEVMGEILYDENGAYAGQVDDFERLLLRRMPKEATKEVMEYLKKKTDRMTYLPHDIAFFYVDDNRYIVRFNDYQLIDLPDGSRWAPAVDFNIWYRDENFIENQEEDLLTINASDYVIYK